MIEKCRRFGVHLSVCVNFGKGLNLSEAQLSHLKMYINNNVNLIELRQGLHKIMWLKCLVPAHINDIIHSGLEELLAVIFLFHHIFHPYLTTLSL